MDRGPNERTRGPRPAGGRAGLALLWLAAGTGSPAACASGAGGRPDTPPGPHAFHGVVVWLGPGRTDTAQVALTADWERTPFGPDTLWTFTGRDANSGLAAFGRLQADTLVWGLVETRGDVTVLLEFRGAYGPGTVTRGCGAVVATGPARPATGPPRAAFALAPASLPAPTPALVPAPECRTR